MNLMIFWINENKKCKQTPERSSNPPRSTCSICCLVLVNCVVIGSHALAPLILWYVGIKYLFCSWVSVCLSADVSICSSHVPRPQRAGRCVWWYHMMNVRSVFMALLCSFMTFRMFKNFLFSDFCFFYA